MTVSGLNPTYSIKYFRPGMYKVVKFHRGFAPHLPSDREVLGEREEEGGKYSQSISRAKSVIYQVAICNDWEWFVSFTIDPKKYDRYSFKPFYEKFTQWLRDYRKKYGCKIEYLLVPEQHKDGAWHMHGLMRGIPADHLSQFVPGIHPQKLIDKGYMNWGRCGAKFGFCSLGPIGDPLKVAGYVTKYITKDLLESNNRFGVHLYRCSLSLRRAQSLGYVYGSYLALDRYLNHHGQFCDVGWAYDVHWSEFLPYLDVSETFVIDYGPDDEVFVDLTSDQFEQLSMFH